MPDKLESLARRLEDDQFFLASALADYAQSEHLSDASLAKRLECPVATLAPLRLCRRPRPGKEMFRRDVQTIADRFNVNANVLAEVVRRADALERMRKPMHAQRGTLLAARDKAKKKRRRKS